MALINFVTPEKVIVNPNNQFKGSFEFKPLEPGFGVTIGNSLRRVLLSSLTGYAITSVKIENVDHEFSTISGILEDVTSIILNLKQIRFKPVEGLTAQEERITLKVENQSQLTAKAFSDATPNFEITNPEFVILNCEPTVSLQLEFIISQGRGYIPADDSKKQVLPIGFIPIDAIYTPIKNVKYVVENMRLGQRTDYEKLIIDIQTDGTISTEDALKESATILIQQLMVITDREIKLEDNIPLHTTINTEHHTSDRTSQALMTPLEDLDLSVRAFNCLKSAKIRSLSELVRYQKEDLLKFRNFGQKSLDEINSVLESKGLSLGMDLSNINLESKNTNTL